MLDRQGQSAKAQHDILVIGASAGGLDPLTRLVKGLPADLPAAVFVVVHISPDARSVLPDILSRAGTLPAAHPMDGEPIQPGRIYVAPPDRHLLVEPGRVRLSSGPRENFSRPAVDPLFRSAAQVYGERVIGVVLSGTLRDGTSGLWDITQRGGLAVVQDPGEASYAAMPHAAMDQGVVDYVVPVAEMAALLTRLVGGTEGGRAMVTSNRSDEPSDREENPDREEDGNRPPGADTVSRAMVEQVRGQRDQTVSVYVCPECGGSLWQVNAGQMARFCCHVGHVFSDQYLLAGYTEDLERALWTSIRTLRDRANLMRQLASDAGERNIREASAWYEEKARLDDEHATGIERMLDDTAPNIH